MVPRNLFIAVVCAVILTCSGLARAEEYRPGEFLTLDLSKAVLSPKALGPASGFTPGPLDVKTDNGGAGFRANTETVNTETAAAQPAIPPQPARLPHPGTGLWWVEGRNRGTTAGVSQAV